VRSVLNVRSVVRGLWEVTIWRSTTDVMPCQFPTPPTTEYLFMFLPLVTAVRQTSLAVRCRPSVETATSCDRLSSCTGTNLYIAVCESYQKLIYQVSVRYFCALFTQVAFCLKTLFRIIHRTDSCVWCFHFGRSIRVCTDPGRIWKVLEFNFQSLEKLWKSLYV